MKPGIFSIGNQFDTYSSAASSILESSSRCIPHQDATLRGEKRGSFSTPSNSSFASSVCSPWAPAFAEINCVETCKLNVHISERQVV